MEIVAVLAIIAIVAVLVISSGKKLAPLDELKKINLSPNGISELQKTIKMLEAGDAYAYWLIGGYYEYGKIHTSSGEERFPKSKNKALLWKLQAAEKGCDIAQYNLGRMYVFGDDIKGSIVEKNYFEALKWLTRATENGEFFSLAALGELYFHGDRYFPGQGVPQDYKKAFELFSRSIEHPHAKQYRSYDAALRIGEMYASGNGVSQDLIQAYKWMKIGGCDPDQHHQFPLKGKLSSEQIMEADALVNDWYDSLGRVLKF